MNNLGDYYSAFIDSTFFMVFMWYYVAAFIIFSGVIYKDLAYASDKNFYLEDLIIIIMGAIFLPLMAPVALIVVIISQIRFPEIVLWGRK